MRYVVERRDVPSFPANSHFHRSITAAFALILTACLPIAAQAQTGTLAFRSGYGPATNLAAPGDCWSAPKGSGCWQKIQGTDSTTGFTWPPYIWGGPGSYGWPSGKPYGNGGVFQLIGEAPADVTPATVADYLFKQIVNMLQPIGTRTNRALYMQVTKARNGRDPMGTGSTQDQFQLFPGNQQTDLYISYWVRFQAGMTKNMIGLASGPGIYDNGGTWRAFFAFKTGTIPSTAGDIPPDNGDYRVEAYVQTGCHPDMTAQQIPPCTGPNPNPAPFWVIAGDNNAGGGFSPVNTWVETNTTVPVPDEGQWSKVEIFWHRSSGPDGRVWMAINGSKIADHIGPNTGAAQLPINRIMVNSLHSGGRLPIYQWVDDIQIWTGGFPTVMDDPPYAPH